ncbi:hypothetical protein [Cyclobacterium plantarum]|uniref:hypothetical protein n=1 Tax=Cyclobacterium plantarum TaxID=2716263 RepID=UPI003F7185B2
MPEKYALTLTLTLVFHLMVYAAGNTQPCPESFITSGMPANYVEIISPEKTVQIPLNHVRVFPGGKERIYILLPDILTSLSTPIIRWNELVLKKPLNSDENWAGTIDRKSFYPTPCIPLLKDGNFSSAESNEGFTYETTNNKVSVKGNISFAQTSGIQLVIHLNIDQQDIPMPLINDLDGEIFTRNGAIPISSGEISYIPSSEVLKGSGLAEGTAMNQSFEFLIPDYRGEPGIFAVNEGDNRQDVFYIYKIEGKPEETLTISKYALKPENLVTKSFFKINPFDMDLLNPDELIPVANYHSQSILIDPKPSPTFLPLTNNAFEGNSPTFVQLKNLTLPVKLGQVPWEKNFTFSFENLPIWNIDFQEESDSDGLKKIAVRYKPPGNLDEQPALAERLTYKQVEQINAGFMEIFKSFDETSDTVKLKTGILQLFENNNLKTEAKISDNFEPFLVTTISGFREAEKYALSSGSGDFNPSMNTEGLELLPVELILKNENGFPESRSFDFHNTAISVTYEGDSIAITASNETQGLQKLMVPNSGLFDIYQFYGILSQLPLEDGYKTDLAFFDVSPKMVLNIGQDSNRERLLIRPVYIHASVEVQESLTYQGQAAYKLKVQFNGLNNPLFAESYEENFTGTYFVSQTSPHQVIRASFEEGLVLQ